MCDYTEVKQKEFWNKVDQRRPPDHPVVVAFAEPKVNFVRKCIEKDQGRNKIKQILDVGCGNGFFTRPLSAWAECTALDVSQRMLDLNPVKAVKVCGDVQSMPFPDNKFDLVFCSNLLHHVSDPVAAVFEMRRVSSRYVVLSEPNRNNPLMFAFGLIKSIERGTLKFSRNYLAALAKQTDLHIVDVETMGVILPNKTPKSLLRFIKLLDGRSRMGFYNVMISHKSNKELT
jgi:SAM-dependent methyltransferase